MANVKCPECGERVKVRENGRRLRCPECGRYFPPPDEDEDVEEAEEERSVRPRSKRKPAASSGLVIGAIVIGSVFLIAIVGAAVVLIVRNSGKDGDSRPIDSAKVTSANFFSLKPGMTLAEIENILGGSRSSSADELRSALRQAGYDETELESAMGSQPALLGEITAWRRWEGQDLRVWVAFVQAKDEQRAAFSTSLTPFRGGYKRELGFIITNAQEVDKASENRKQEDSLRNDAKWLRGAQASQWLIGEWRDEKANGYLFAPSGNLVELNIFEQMPGRGLTFRILDDRYVEIITPSPFAPMPGHPPPPSFVNLTPTTQRYEYFVNQDELALIDVSKQTIMGAPTLYRTFYRLPVRSGSVGETQLLASILADLKGDNVQKRDEAFEKLRRMAKGLAVALPELVDLLNSPNSHLMELAGFIIGDMKENAGPAVPTLIGLLRSSNGKQATTAAQTLGSIGPAARDALPVLRLAGNQFNNLELQAAALRAIDSIENRKYRSDGPIRSPKVFAAESD